VADTSGRSKINPGDTLLRLEIVTPVPKVVEERTSISLIL
jgi:hypothetical protein